MSDQAPVSTAPIADASATTSTPAADPVMDSRLATIAREEQRLRQAKADWKRQQGEYVSKADLQALYKTDRAKFAEIMGTNPDAFPMPTVSAPEPKDELTALKEELAALKGSFQTKERSETEREFKGSINSFISEKTDDYELIHSYEALDTVYDYMLDYYRENNEVVDMKEACDAVENYLFQQLQRGTKAKKVSALFQPTPEPGTKTPSPTLNGTMTSPTQTTGQRLSEEESKKRAASLIKWT